MARERVHLSFLRLRNWDLGERGPLEDMLQPWGLVDFDRRRCTITSDPHLADGAQMAKTSHGQSGLI